MCTRSTSSRRTHTEFTWSVRPLVRIATADPSHHYHRSLYDPIAADVVETSFGGHLVHRLEAARARLATWMPSTCTGPNGSSTRRRKPTRSSSLLEETGTTLVWTQHNLRPHREVERAEELYQRFASAAQVVIHHSQWGRDAVLERYRFRADAKHVVLPHGHFGSLDRHHRGGTRRRRARVGPRAVRLAHRHRRCTPPGEADGRVHGGVRGHRSARPAAARALARRRRGAGRSPHHGPPL